MSTNYIWILFTDQKYQTIWKFITIIFITFQVYISWKLPIEINLFCLLEQLLQSSSSTNTYSFIKSSITRCSPRNVLATHSMNFMLYRLHQLPWHPSFPSSFICKSSHLSYFSPFGSGRLAILHPSVMIKVITLIKYHNAYSEYKN